MIVSKKGVKESEREREREKEREGNLAMPAALP